MSYKKILVTVDGSATSNAGLTEAIGLAKSLRARLRVIHVVDLTPVLNIPEGGTDFGALENGIKRVGAKVVDAALAATARHGVRADSAMPTTRGPAVADCVVAEAKRFKADLIVIGTHGRSGLGRLLMGSTAELVVHSTRAPVLLVHGPAKRATKRAPSRGK
jgi:nucleotide-binding universal stress UspA family protein